ncbi:AMP-binding protein [Natrinema altunense]|uniref:Long-chain fatty acid--CoA ligase n=1 Tax=Natrinema altunense TaxID=222984 RepID=A0A482XY56_9EURY|nr:class I adenylate-forming enzyme family protein [Natrinema altunense]RZH68878.1 long-chain fatty acid--CoA ligase [Natrinema altunense]
MEATAVTLSLARRADHVPDRTAVVDISEARLYAPATTINEDRVSYGDLSSIATRTAERLAALGIGSGDTVCLVTRNRVAVLGLFFACRRLGATFAPISHLLTPASVERPFDIVAPDLVVSEPAQRDLVRSIPFDRSVTLEELSETDRAGLTVDDRRPGESPLLALHGRSGRPVAGYGSETLERNCRTGIATWGLAANDVVPLTTPLSAPDGLVRVALSVLYVGGTLLLDRAFDPGDAARAIAAEGATLLPGRATALRDIAAEPGFDAAADSLERAVCEAPVDGGVIEAYRDRDVPVARVSGRLECPTALSEGFADAARASDVDDSPVGRPVPDCRARLVDDEGTVLEGAAVGRLQLSGPVVADGYVNAAGTDDERWTEPTPPPNAEDDVGDCGRFVDGWFDTGDRFRRDDAGGYHLQ